jgi:acetyltransferase-like isoleucine patch superfamily enzyme
MTEPRDESGDAAGRIGIVQRLRGRESRAARGAAALLSVLDPRPWGHVLRLVHHHNYTHVEPMRRAAIDRSARIAPNVSIAHGERVSVGARTHVNARTHLWAGPSTGRIDIGADCLLAPGVFVTASDYGTSAGHRILDQPRRERDVRIGDDCWLGTGVVVVAGVEIGDGCVVGAGAVVTRSLPPGSVAVGVPARVVARRGGDAVGSAVAALEGAGVPR